MAGSAFERVATSVKAVFDAEFATEQFRMQFDNLHEAVGRDRVAVGIAPVEDRANARTRIMQEAWLEVKFYGLWDDTIAPDTVINPFKITAYAERLRDALRRSQATDPGTGQVWFFDVDRTQYPNDPTGNKSRFVMTIRAFGNNANLTETTD